MNKEALLAKWSEPVKVGTDGFVRLVDCMGNDNRIVQAARVSYGKGTKTVMEDRALIRYLMRHRHSTPIEKPVIELHVRAPMDVIRQWFRSRTWSYNEYSTRYSEAIDAQNLTPPNGWRTQSRNNKQGSGYYLDTPEGERLTRMEEAAINTAVDTYQALLHEDIAREQARKVLPLATYSEFYGTVNLHNLFHFLSLRMHPHAQLEIREFAEVIAEIVKDWVPHAWEAFEDYRLGGCFFSRKEMNILREWLYNSQINEYRWEDPEEEDCNLVNLANLSDNSRKLWLAQLDSKREKIEFWNKIK